MSMPLLAASTLIGASFSAYMRDGEIARDVFDDCGVWITGVKEVRRPGGLLLFSLLRLLISWSPELLSLL